jgi:hypothetical protein
MTKLTQLYLNSNDIADISPLAGMTGLTQLNLGLNQIANASPLAGMAGLARLQLYQLTVSVMRGALEGWRLFQNGVYAADFNGGYYTHPNPEVTCHQFWSDGKYARYDREGDGHHETIFLVQRDGITYVGSLDRTGTFVDVAHAYSQYFGNPLSDFVTDIGTLQAAPQVTTPPAAA